MSTADSPLSKLRAEAGKMAHKLKYDMARSVNAKDPVKVALVMDDKAMSLEFSLRWLRQSSEGAIRRRIVELMQTRKEPHLRGQV